MFVSEPEDKVFDPGPDEWDLDTLSVVSQMMGAVHGVNGRAAVMLRGAIICGEIYFDLDKVLMDTGALHSSYISRDLVDKHRDAWRGKVMHVNGKVRLGDNKTEVNVTERIKIDVVLRAPDQQPVTAVVDFCVWDMPGMDMIIGLPDILDHFLVVLVTVLETARRDRQEDTEENKWKVHHGYNRTRLVEGVSVLGSIMRDFPDAISPWTQPQEEVSPEEEETPMPCSFTGPMYYLSKPYQEVLDDYTKMHERQSAPDWYARKDFRDFLMEPESIAVFVPKEWTGIKDLVPLELQFKPDMPAVHKCHARTINPKIFEPTRKEMERMCTYMYDDSDSPIAVPLVVAPKATAPFIRICGDYVWTNKFIVSGCYFIPHIQHELERAAGFKFFHEMDLTNAFHQVPLAEHTSNMLSVMTPWGLKRPKFMPEGIAPASGILQRTVMSLFFDFKDWILTLFDNLLILCHTYDDGMDKLRKVRDRCYERNVVLKFSKSTFGFTHVKFFGYKVEDGKWCLDDDRKQAVTDTPMPTDLKRMQRFLGVGIFFSEFIPDYATKSAKLYDMTKPSFNWDQSTWKEDYLTEFENMKRSLAESVDRYFPDWDLPWILRVDASDVAVCAVLLMVKRVNDKDVFCPLGFKSTKFSGAAIRWDIHKKEAFACY